MTYVLNGVTVDVSQQAVRPREPARPPVKFVASSPELATRELRPRMTRVPGVMADKLVEQVIGHKNKQAALEKLLTQMGKNLKANQAAGQKLQRAGQREAYQDILVARTKLEGAIDRCINEIKNAAAAANDAANGAVKNGATREQVKAAAASVAPTSASEAVVESATASVLPNGDIVVGPDASLVSTPTQASSMPVPSAMYECGGYIGDVPAVVDPAAAAVAQADPTVAVPPPAACSIVGVGAAVGAMYVAYRILRKKQK